MAAFRVYENELIDADERDANRVPFRAFTLQSFIDALAEAGADGIARDLWGRYADRIPRNPSSHVAAVSRWDWSAKC
jgi:hypothetical protein